MKQRKTDAETEATKVFVRRVIGEFKRVSPDIQQFVLREISRLIDEETHPKTKEVFIKLRMIFVEAAKTEVQEDEK